MMNITRYKSWGRPHCAGYIERWGRGIEKICDACKELGTELPVYELRGNSLRVHFKALQSALIDQPKAPKRQDDVLVLWVTHWQIE